ncbi:CRTAC1 family protein [Lutimonas zeaxanthinifaciens]|uniref:CRTAC1 family protein n=1 Tax=Lutimonas zeaxanthinifaciens TaxID=3060215 RepID=UPI00265CAE30|nr:CRTAC1 family protein [Lutimonas sp. YSD2104]WKK64914.1 CRTAC1 family protein [Lutimonas sp. YSD2104]
MKFKYLFTIVILFQFSGCEKKETPKQTLEFTREGLDFTADRSNKIIDHIRMTDITASSGIDFKHINGAFGNKWMPETIGSGGGFFDYNNDGWPDIFLVNGAYWPGHGQNGNSPTPALYRNNQDGTFTDVSSKSGLNFSIYGMGCSFADFDADGDMDIYITAVGTNKLLKNENGVFQDVTEKMGVTGNDPDQKGSQAWSTGAAWVDVDRDGWLDLFVDNYVKWTPETDIYATRDGKTKSYATPDIYQGESCRLYRNVKGHHFEDITEKAGVLNTEGKSLGIAIADFNKDNWPDIVVSNDTQPNFLYINDGDGTFTNQAIIAGIGYDEKGRARAGMGIDIADVANDDNLAIAIGNFSQEPLSLYTQTTGGLFQDRAGVSRLTRASLLQLTFGVHFSDLDRDGFVELITANGHIEPEINGVQQNITFEQKPQIFSNDNGIFTNVSEHVGESFNTPVVGRGIATADIDKDGDLDILLTINGGSPRLFRNETEQKNNSLIIKLNGKKPNQYAIGAKINIWNDGDMQSRMLRTGSSYLSQSDIGEVIIGIGKNEKADSIRITWPGSGKETMIREYKSGPPLIISE